MSISRRSDGNPANTYKIAFWILPSILVLILSTLAGGCFYLARGSAERHELERLTSPDGKTDAVIASGESVQGATGGPSMEVYLVPFGQDLSGENRSLLVDYVEDSHDIELRWHDKRILEVRYSAAAISDFRNYKYLNSKQGNEYVVEVRLSPLSDNTSLPDVYY
ncbi:MAG: hypothetical protein H0T74_11955 [Rubrobacteraceae bacterium]|nr:hypothetical protein [Rubrobacteraceae bacterium]